jgi:hypothetical protein
MASAFPPNATELSGGPVTTIADLQALLIPKEGTRRFVQSANVDYQFALQYLTAVTGESTETPANPRSARPTDNTAGIWQPAEPNRPSDAWVLTSPNRNDINTFYRRRYYGGTVKSISFEVNEPSATNAQTPKRVISISDFAAVIAGTETVSEQSGKQANSPFYGGPAVFIRPIVGGITSIVVVAVRADGTVIINNINLAETASGLIRRVVINGIPADPLPLQSIDIPTMPTITAPNLTDFSLGTFDTSGDASGGFVSHRAGARLESLNFTFRDRRTASFPNRWTNVVLNLSDFSGGSGWTYRIDNTPSRSGISRDITVDGGTYTLLIQWTYTPTGILFYFQDGHSSAWNSYGRFENVTIKWSAS